MKNINKLLSPNYLENLVLNPVQSIADYSTFFSNIFTASVSVSVYSYHANRSWKQDSGFQDSDGFFKMGKVSFLLMNS